MKAALYARFSTEKQREASIEDQFRECERVAERNDLTVINRFSDAAISGGTASRPGYQAMLAAARAGKFSVIVVEDISRLWRSRAEFGPRSAELEDLGVHMITAVGDDTRRDGWALIVQIKQAMAEHYRREVSYRTRRGLEGRAIKKAPTGGRSYGYRSAAESLTSQREVHAEQAEVVRRIFRMYSDGLSARAIADRLNAEAVPSPGSTWKRSERRSGGWLASAIAGDARRGLGILNNELYCGRVIWNRFRWQRLAADSSKRRMVQNPKSTWIVHEDERLRIVPQELWQAVKRRQQAQADTIGERVRRGLARSSAKSTGRQPKYLLSGLLRCGSCGASLVVSGGQYYACSTRVNGGRSACGNDARIALKVVEPLLLNDLKKSLRSPAAIAEACRRIRQQLRTKAVGPKATQAQLARAEREVANLTEAIATGAFRGSPGLAARLHQAEANFAELQSKYARPEVAPSVERLVVGLEKRVESTIGRFERVVLEVGSEPGRQEIRQLLGRFKVEADDCEIKLYNEQGRLEAALSRAVGATDARNYGSGGALPRLEDDWIEVELR